MPLRMKLQKRISMSVIEIGRLHALFILHNINFGDEIFKLSEKLQPKRSRAR